MVVPLGHEPAFPVRRSKTHSADLALTLIVGTGNTGWHCQPPRPDRLIDRSRSSPRRMNPSPSRPTRARPGFGILTALVIVIFESDPFAVRSNRRRACLARKIRQLPSTGRWQHLRQTGSR